ncbi:MAG: hypothetical protein K2X03_19545 [Bryobacteraceae bacterium]|nr:hypothetical protein [Bryobacteraceae bacterium]
MKIGKSFSSIALLGLSMAALMPQLAAQSVVASPSSLTLNSPANSNNVVSQTLTLTVTGGNGRTLTIGTAGASWIRVSAPAFSQCVTAAASCIISNPPSSISVTVQANPTGLPAGSPQAAVSLSLSDVATAVQVPVTFNVGGSGGGSSVLNVSATTLTFNALPGGAGQSQTVQVSNTGNSIQYNVASNASWLSTNLGTIAGTSPGQLIVTANASSLPANTYTGILTLTPVGGGQGATITVTLVVSTAQQLQVNPSALNFSFITGSGQTPSSTLQIGVTTGSAVTYNVAATYGAGATNWLTTSPASTGTSGNSSLPTNLTVTANPGSLSAGTYTATLSISSNGLSTVNIPVTLVVSAPPNFTVSTNSLTINVQPGTTASRTVTVNTSTGASVGYNVTTAYVSPSTGNWLTVGGSSGSTPGSITVGVSPGSLSVGNYTGTVTIASTTPGVPQQVINVTMVVTNSQIVTFSPASLSFSFVGGGGQPSTQFVQLGLTPATPVQTATVGAVPDIAGQNWLTASLSSPNGTQITGNAAAVVNVNPTGLANGTYTGKVQVNVAGSVANALVEIPVSLTVTGVTGGSTGGGGTGSTTLLLSQSPVNFNLSTSGSFDQILTLTSSSSTAITYSLSNTAPWLNILNPNGTTTGSVTLRASSTNLAAGTYNTSVTINAPGATNNGSTFPVNLTVSSSNQLQTSPSGHLFSYVSQSGAFPPSQTLQVSASTVSTLSVTATASVTGSVNWLSVTPSSVNTLNNFVVSINSSVLPSLAAGTYTGNITLQAPGAVNSTVNVPVTLVITGTSTGGGGGGTTNDQLIPSVTQMSFFSTQNAGTVSQPLELYSLSGGAIAYSLTAAAGNNGTWLTVSPGSGSTPGSTTVQANTSGLSPGTYTGSITVNAPGTVSPVTVVNVNLTIAAQANLTVNPGGVVFSVPAGSTSLVTRSISVGSTTGAQLPITVTSQIQSSNVTVSTNNSVTPATITVTLNPAGFSTGVLSNTITVNSSGANNNPVTVPVTLIVTGGSSGGGGAAQLSLSPSSLSFSAAPNGVAPPQRSVAVTSTGSAISYAVTTNQPWLLAGTNGTTPGTINVGVNPSNLQVGTYTGNVTVTGSGGSTVVLPVTFEITNNPVLQISTQSVTFNYQTGQALPGPRPITVSTSSGTSAPVTVAVTTSSGGNWLTTSALNLQAPGVFALSLVNNIASTLAAGTYTATVTVGSSGTAGGSSIINVTLNVSATPLLTVSTTPINFNAQFNGTSPAAQTRSITATSGQLNLSVNTTTVTNQGWLIANVNSNSTPATLTISASPFGLGTGIYSGSVTVTSGSGGTPQVIPVTLNVSAISLLNVDRSELVFGAGGTGATQTIQVASTGGSLSYTVNPSVSNSPTNWLQVNTFNGTTPSTLTVTANSAQLGDGTYFGTISLTSPGSAPVLIPVTLVVNQSTALQVAPATVPFTVPQGSLVPQPAQSITVTSQVQTPFTFTTTVNSPVGGNWLNVTQSGGLTNGFLQAQPNANASTLPPGIYTATIFVSGANSPNTAQVAVTLTVVPSATLQVTPASLTFAGRVGQPNPPAQTIQLTSSNPAASQVSYNVQSDATWLSGTPVSGSTPGTVSVSVNVAGLTAGTYTGRLSITPTGSISGAQASVVTVTFTVEQVPIPNVTGFANAATFQPGSLAPGMIISLLGTNLGPTTAVNGQVVAGRFTTTLAGVRVLFDGIPAPILYASDRQINAVVPYGLAGRASSRMTVEYNGIVSNLIEPRLVDTAPGIFTVDGRQAAAINENGTVNGPANPAVAGSIIAIYVTGEGSTTPAGVDGEVVSATNLKRPLGAVRVRVGGIEVPAASIFYAGSAPSLVAGLMQLNFRLPANTPTGVNTTVEVFVGSGQSLPGVTISVR